jgi:hypothetical protein
MAHEAGLAVAPWATSDPRVLGELIAAGVDAIGTNHPDVLRRVLSERPNVSDSIKKKEVSPTGARVDADDPRSRSEAGR